MMLKTAFLIVFTGAWLIGFAIGIANPVCPSYETGVTKGMMDERDQWQWVLRIGPYKEVETGE